MLRLNDWNGRATNLGAEPIPTLESRASFYTIYEIAPQSSKWSHYGQDQMEKQTPYLLKVYKDQRGIEPRFRSIVSRIAKHPQRVALVREARGLPRTGYRLPTGELGIVIEGIRNPDGALSLEYQSKEQPPLSETNMYIRLQQAMSLARQVATIHGLGLVHGDLTPRNILMQRQADVIQMPVLIDIDQAALLRSSRIDGEYRQSYLQGMEPTIKLSVIKDQDYAAPELANGANTSQATDLWALGVILHKILFTPQQPFFAYQSGSLKLSHFQAVHQQHVPWPPRGTGVQLQSTGVRMHSGIQEWLGSDIMALFRRVFDRSPGSTAFDPPLRPTAKHWVQVLASRYSRQSGWV